MHIYCGVDIGATNTKLVVLDGDLGLSTGRIIPSTSGDIISVINDYVNQFGTAAIALTGVGAHGVRDARLNAPVHRVDEFTALGLGGLTLAGLEEAVVVSMGTGTAFVHAGAAGYRHIIGTGVGGGTLLGLCTGLVGAEDISSIEGIAGGGDLKKVNLTIGEVAGGRHHTLSPDLTASNFASIKPDAAAADWALGAMNLVLEVVGTLSVLSARLAGVSDVVLTGSLTGVSLAPKTYSQFTDAYGVRFVIPERAALATAYGAALAAAGARGAAK